MWKCEGFFWGPLSFQGVAKGDGISDPSGALSKGMLWLICAAVSAEKVSIAEKAFSATVKSIFGVLAFPRGKTQNQIHECLAGPLRFHMCNDAQSS